MIAETLKTEAGQRQHYAAVKARLSRPQLRIVHNAADAARERLSEIAAEDARAAEEAKSEVKEAFETSPRLLSARWRDIITEVCLKHKVRAMEILSDRRAPYIVAARHECMYRMRMETPLSLPQIGIRLGGMNHASILHGIKRHQERMKDLDK